MGEVTVTPLDIDRDALIRSFAAESEEGLSALEQHVMAIESGEAQRSHLEEIFRLAHTLKGNAVLLDFPTIAEFAHSVEDLLDSIRETGQEATNALATLLLRAVDMLRRMVADALSGNERTPPEAAYLLKQIAEFRTNGIESRSGSHGNIAGIGAAANPGFVRSNVPSRDANLTLRVDLEKLDRMINLAGEIAIARGRLDSELQNSTADEALSVHREADVLHSELQELILRLRMVRIEPALSKFRRTIRDLAASSGKQVRLVIDVGEVELDTRVIELIRDPLMHMLRNAIDHGIEPPTVRRERGKPACGVVTLKASHAAGSVVIELNDDGAGFDRDEIISRARQRGLVTEHQKLSDAEAFRFVFEPGFTTAKEVTELSGRGVGMDVVRRNIDALRGSITIESSKGVGATITLRIPLTLAIINGFSVRVGVETYVIPLDSVLECFAVPDGQQHCNGGGVVWLRGEPLPYIRLRDTFGVADCTSTREQIVVVKHEDGSAGFVVDALIGEAQAVIKPLGRMFDTLRGISGSTILGDGRVALILDVGALVREVMKRHEREPASSHLEPEQLDFLNGSLQPHAGEKAN